MEEQRNRRAHMPSRIGGFLLLLAAVFAVAYGIGAAVDPVAPGPGGGTAEIDVEEGTDISEEPGMSDMPGMGH
ncbi:hypothetical protein ACIQNG_12415 [Streptomyces sp. NPDC091377]|uniref:hypothetical protein n=1 Tax=Streptomyces sp. NPDC091377 TaxID=3365995 RepID=UPI00381A32FA